jgi:hypothetical protein
MGNRQNDLPTDINDADVIMDMGTYLQLRDIEERDNTKREKHNEYMREYMREYSQRPDYRQKRNAYMREYARRYRREHYEEYREKMRKYYQETKYSKTYYEQHKDEINAKRKQKRLDDKNRKKENETIL